MSAPFFLTMTRGAALLAALGTLSACSLPSLGSRDAASDRAMPTSVSVVDKAPARPVPVAAATAVPMPAEPLTRVAPSAPPATATGMGLGDARVAAEPTMLALSRDDAAGASSSTAAVVLREIVATPVVFNFDRHEIDQVRPSSLQQLDHLVARLKAFREATVTEIRLVGHADRLNSTGQADYNQKLAAKRVATVRRMLIERGVSPALLRTASAGAREQVKACDDKSLDREALHECLLPNRRVDVHVISRR